MKREQSQQILKAWYRTSGGDGFSLVEVILSGAIFALLATTFVGAYLYGQESAMLAGNRTRAVFLAEEGLEAVRNIRDESYANLSDGTYGLALSGNQWIFSGTQDATDIFTRTVSISSVDTVRKLITSTVLWQQNPERSGSVSVNTYLTDWMAVISGSWANPTQEASVNISGNSDAVKVQTQGNYAYVIVPSGSPNFFVIDISTPASPTITGSLSLNGAPQNIFVSGNYAYIASNSNSQELQVVDISVPSTPSLAGVYNAAGNADALGVFVTGTTASLIRANSANDEFFLINVSDPSNPSFLGSLNLGASGYEVVVFGNYAYIASGDNNKELQVIDVSSPSTPFLSGTGINLAGNTDATTISFSGTTLFLGQGSALFVINAANPLLPVNIGSFTATGTINDIALDLGNTDTYVFLATSDTAGEFQVVNVAVPAVPVLLGSYDIAGSNFLMGVAYSIAHDRAFAVGQSNTQEFIVLAPQ